MTTYERAEFIRMLLAVSSLYGKPMSKPLVELYWAALQRFELAAVQQALQAHVNHPDYGQYLPKPADIVRALQGDSRSQALRAWSRVVEAVRTIGSYSSVIFDDPLIHAVLHDMGGWIRLCQSREQDLPFCGKEFATRYASYLGKPLPPYPRQLTGSIDHQNAVQHLPLAEPVCVGDPEKAEHVYRGGQAVAGLRYSALPRRAVVRLPSPLQEMEHV